MELGGLYNFVLILILTGFLVGVGVLALDKMMDGTGTTTAANVSIVAARNAVGEIASNWMSLIVTIGVLALIIGLIVGGFAMYQRR